MQDPVTTTETAISSLYLLSVTIAGYIGWAVVKIFKKITPHASKVVATMVSEWIVELLRPVIAETIDQKIGSSLKDLEKIKRATHDRSPRDEIVLHRLVEVADKLEHSGETIDRLIKLADKLDKLGKDEK